MLVVDLGIVLFIIIIFFCSVVIPPHSYHFKYSQNDTVGVQYYYYCESYVFLSFVRSHTFYVQGTELCVGPDPYRKGSITGN